MEFFERDVENGLDKIFDLNRDGKINPAEQDLILNIINGEDEDELDDGDDDE